MVQREKLRTRNPRRTRGFSIVELLIVLLVIMIITGVALPAFLRAYQSYQVGDAASRMADIIKFTRFEAIRRNTPISCLIQQPAGTTTAWTDSNGTGVKDPTERQVLFSGTVGPIAAGAPNGLAASVGTALTAVSLTNGAIRFDQRGALTIAAVDVIYVGNTAVPGAGYRAVVVLPSGSIQLWTAPAGGPWVLVN